MKWILKYFPEIFLFIVFSFLIGDRLNADFWNDEIYTLQYFVFTSISSTLTDYHVPNNHILFNLINNVYLKFLGADSFFSIIETPYQLRLIPLFYSFLLFIFVYKIGKSFFNITVARLSIICLITTIPYLNFVLQIRGYGLSALLLTVVFYFSFSFLAFPKRKEMYLIASLSAMLLYTIPSNLYPYLGLIFYVGILFFLEQKGLDFRNKNISSVLKLSKTLRLLVSLSFGVLISLVFYTPIFKEVFFNEYVQPKFTFHWFQIRRYVPHFLIGTISGKWFLAIISFIGLALNFVCLKKWQNVISAILSICIIPFILLFLRGDAAPPRIFVVLLPLTSLLFAVGLFLFWNYFNLLFKGDNIFIFVVFLLSIVSFFNEKQKIRNVILTDIKENRRTQNLYYQYYSEHYQPLEDMSYFKENYFQKKIPVVIMDCEPHGIYNYLEKYEIPYHNSNSFDSLKMEYDSLYLITNHPYKYMENMEENNISILNKKLTYHNILFFIKDKN